MAGAQPLKLAKTKGDTGFWYSSDVKARITRNLTFAVSDSNGQLYVAVNDISLNDSISSQLRAQIVKAIDAIARGRGMHFANTLPGIAIPGDHAEQVLLKLLKMSMHNETYSTADVIGISNINGICGSCVDSFAHTRLAVPVVVYWRGFVE